MLRREVLRPITEQELVDMVRSTLPWYRRVFWW